MSDESNPDRLSDIMNRYVVAHAADAQARERLGQARVALDAADAQLKEVLQEMVGELGPDQKDGTWLVEYQGQLYEVRSKQTYSDTPVHVSIEPKHVHRLGKDSP